MFVPAKGSHKGENGKLLIVAGSKEYHGSKAGKRGACYEGSAYKLGIRGRKNTGTRTSYWWVYGVRRQTIDEASLYQCI